MSDPGVESSSTNAPPARWAQGPTDWPASSEWSGRASSGTTAGYAAHTAPVGATPLDGWAGGDPAAGRRAPGHTALGDTAADDTAGDDIAGDVRAAAAVIGILAVLGVLAGIVWGLASPHSLGFVAAPGQVIPNETEQFIAADGRFLFITVIIGVFAGAVCWFWRARRGPVMAVGLAVGGLVGAALTALVGHLIGGGHAGGALNARITLPITVHARGFLGLEAGSALLVYLGGTLMSAPDDLGRRPSARPAADRVPGGPA
jgi:hypothetical protein